MKNFPISLDDKAQEMPDKSALLDDEPLDRTKNAPSDSAPASRRTRVANTAVSIKTLMISALILALVVGSGAMMWQLHAKSNDLDALLTESANETRAEQVALDYAVGAAEMDFKDLAPWRTRLTDGTSPELSNRLTQAATSMEQIITPLQWVAKPTPITAKVSSHDNGTYSVDCFVSVLTTNSQAPEGIQSTATYSLTIDSEHDWTITEIGGIDAALPSTPR